MPTGRRRVAATGRLPIPVTSSWSSRLPHGYAAIGISRGPPRGRRGYRMYKALAPGDWFRAVDEKTFVERYMAQLAGLDADQVLHELARLFAAAISRSTSSFGVRYSRERTSRLRRLRGGTVPFTRVGRELRLPDFARVFIGCILSTVPSWVFYGTLVAAIDQQVPLPR
jgi:hypothetical protein